jgi:hypothetical protein
MSNWLYKTPHEWRLLLQKGRTFETIHECPLEIYPLFKERLKENMTSGVEGDNRCRKRTPHPVLKHGAFLEVDILMHH